MKTYISKTLSILFLASVTLFTACSSDDNEMIREKPSLTELEIGYGNNKQGVIGRDFHFETGVLAGDKIDMVQINIKPIKGESYSRDWSFEIAWDKFKGLKSTTVHEHFDIPKDAPEGNFEFVITVKDKNGTELQEVHKITIIDPVNLPADPFLYIWMVTTDQGDFHYINETLENPIGVELSKGEILNSDATINKVKGNGKMYLLLIRKEHNHLPETVEAIDFSKVIVYDVFEHKNQQAVYSFGNIIYDGLGGFTREAPKLTVGAAFDNNVPNPYPIAGEKAWKSGEYYFGVVYTNTTYNMSIHHYFTINIDMK